MGPGRKWQQELIGIAWINIALVVISLPLFAIYIVESLQYENYKKYIHTSKGYHFMEVTSKYLIGVLYWVPMSILLKAGATKPSYTIIKICSLSKLIFVFLLALQIVLEPPHSILVVSAYAVVFAYLLASTWIMKNYMEELKAAKDDDGEPVIWNTLNSSDSTERGNESYDELNDVADQQTVFRLAPIIRMSTPNNNQ